MPEISIIVPVYKVEKYINKCVDSILNQTFKDFELILVDDGSPDRCGQICDEYAKKDPRIKVIHKENGGLSDSRNCGIEIATGKYIGFIDSDDYIEKDMYELLYNNIEKYDADVSVCGIYNDYNNLSVSYKNPNEFYILNNEEALKLVLIGSKIPVAVWNKIYKRCIFDNIKFPVGKLFEDAFTIPTVLSRAQKVVVSTSPKYHYVHRKDSITTSEFKLEDFNVVEAYNINLKLVRDKFPKLEKEAMHRHLWSYICVIDKMILSENFEKSKDYYKVLSKLRKNTLKILFNPYFTFKRKLSTILILFSDSLYIKMVKINQQKNMELFD